MKNELERDDIPWLTLVSICEKCGKKLSHKDENPSHELRAWLKEKIKDRDLKGKVRAVTSSCLDVCPEGSVAVTFTGKSAPDCVVIDPKNDRDRLFEMIGERTNKDFSD